jgi:hypothetical protein
MMVYNTQNYWAFGFCPSFSILKTREHSILEVRGRETYSVGSLGKSYPQSLDSPVDITIAILIPETRLC